MKKLASIALVVSFVFSSTIGVFAQKRKITTVPVATQDTTPAPVASQEFAVFGRVNAYTEGSGVIVQWEMASELANFGFYVYRIDPTGKQRVSEVMVPGSAAHSQTERIDGTKYDIYDPVGGIGSTYVIESLGVSGKRAVSYAVNAQYTPDLKASTGTTVRERDSKARSATGNIEQRQLELTKDLQSEVTASLGVPDPVMHAWVVAQSGATIGVRKEGMYRVTRAELQATGFDVNSSSTFWRLFTGGVEQAINIGGNGDYIEFYGKAVDTQESDTKAYYLITGSTAGLRMRTRVSRPLTSTVVSKSYQQTFTKKERTFYDYNILNGDLENYWGRGITPAGTTLTFIVSGVDFTTAKFDFEVKLHGFNTADHAVDVTLNGQLLGQAVGSGTVPFSSHFGIPTAYLVEGTNTLLLTGTAGPADSSMFDTINVNYKRKQLADENRINFYTDNYRGAKLEGFVAPQSSIVTIYDGAPPASTADAVQNLQASSTPGMIRMGSGRVSSGESYTGTDSGKAKITVSRVFGNTGSVSADLTLSNGTATGGTACTAGVDFINPGTQTVTFANGVNTKTVDVTLCADGVPESGETFNATLSNPTGGATLAQTNIRLFETTNDSTPVEVTNLSVQTSGAESSVTLPAYRGAVTYAVDDSRLLQAPVVIANNGSYYATNPLSAQLVILAHANFMTQAEDWANYRRSQGVTVLVVDVADVYDEYNYGVASTDAITAFLHHAQDAWGTQYVLLVGDTTYDPRNYEGFGYNAFVLTKFVNTVYMETGSDEALADFTVPQDGLAEMAVGRIPARTPDVVTNALAKVVRFETVATQHSFDRGGLFAYDEPNGFDFAFLSQEVRDQFPPTMPTVFVPRGPNNEGHQALMDAINAPGGKYIVNYSGHGSTGVWSNANFFGVGHVQCSPGPDCVSNTDHESLFMLLTCLNGYFMLQTNDSLAEALLKTQNGGAVAVWASTGQTTPDIQRDMALRFASKTTEGQIPRIGDLIKDAKSVLQNGADVRFSWALIGDPMLKIR